MQTTIDSGLLTRMFMAGAANLEANREWINELNVFPVPDGDTGTNMTMTILSAVREVQAALPAEDMKTVCKAMSSGSLRGARGNSGVILSQLLRGFCKVVRDQETIDVPLMAEGFERGVETAYKAVMKPKEGTILTVAKGASDKARELAVAGVTDFDEFIPQVIACAEEVLAQTPEMLPVLKQAGVVDSGGQGLVQVLKGAYEAYQGLEIDYDAIGREDAASSDEESEEKTRQESRYGYCASFRVLLEKNFAQSEEKDLKNYLLSIGEISAYTKNEKELAMEVMTNNPGLAIQRGLLYGQLLDICINNLRVEETKEGTGKLADTAPLSIESAPAPSYPQYTKFPEQPAQTELPRKEVGFVAVAAGEGLEEIFKGLGVDYVISGGQTMNPSTEDILKAIDKVNASTVFVLPNNKNIILAANQAAELMTTKKIVVIPTTTVPQGITAVINYMPDVDVETAKESMTEEIGRVRTVEVTYAVRDTSLDGKDIHEGDMMAIGDAGLVCVGKNYNDTAVEGIGEMVTDDTEIISIYYGADVTEKDAEAVRKKIAAAHPGIDVELQAGGQPVYYYILSAE